MDDQQLLRETADYVAITRVEAAYADVVTRHAWAELADLFLPHATVHVDTVTSEPVELVGPEQLGKFIANAIERFEMFEFVILNTVVQLGAGADRDRAGVRLYMCELRQEAASGRWTNAFGVYHDRCRRVEGRWWFESRRYRSLARTGRNDVFDFPHHLRID